jgi:hypothetical protein
MDRFLGERIKKTAGKKKKIDRCFRVKQDRT